jgi:hypothetical protein
MGRYIQDSSRKKGFIEGEKGGWEQVNHTDASTFSSMAWRARAMASRCPAREISRSGSLGLN